VALRATVETSAFPEQCFSFFVGEERRSIVLPSWLLRPVSATPSSVNRVYIHCVMIPRRHAGRPDRPRRATQTKTRSTAREATRQRQYNESMSSAHLAEALRRHGVAVCTTRTSSSMMSDITDQLAQLMSKTSKSSSDEDIPVRHGPRGPERPPQC
jgi:hypothetical protein